MQTKDLAFEDGVDLDKWRPIIGGSTVWLLVKDKGEVMAICKLGVIQVSMIDFHPYVMPGKCRRWKSIVKCLLIWIYSNKRINKVISFIGTNHTTTYNLALKTGFNDEGLIKKSYLKNGELHDQHIVGLTREQIGDLI